MRSQAAKPPAVSVSHRKRAMVCLLLTAAAAVPSATLADGLLQRFRNESREPRSPATGSAGNGTRNEGEHERHGTGARGDHDCDRHVRGRHRHHHAGDRPGSEPRLEEEEEGSCWSDLLDTTVLFTITSPWWLPHVMLSDDFDRQMRFRPPPYGTDAPYLADIAVAEDTDRRRGWAGRVRLDYFDDFDAVGRIGGQLLLTTASRWGLDSETHYWFESLGPQGTDELWTGDFNVTFRFAQSERTQFYTGLGFNWLADAIGSEFGFNFTYGADFFPARPWVLSATIDWGRVGSESLFHGRASVGWLTGRIELFAGYDYFKIGGASADGILGGIRVWF